MSKGNLIKKNWHTLDNTAKIFPIISSRKSSNVFRLSVTLKSNIDPEKLQLALDKTLPWFKVFQVRLKKGFFWYYFEANNKRAKINEENTYPCGYMNIKENDKFLFKVTYYKKRINLEVFHSLSDGNGAVDFLKALTFNYIKLIRLDDNNANLDELLIPDIDCTLDVEDSYVRNYSKSHINLDDNKTAYTIKEKKLPLSVISVISGHMKADELLKLCRSKNVTITEYINAVLIWSIYNEYQIKTKSKKPIKVYIPVNLRKFFDSSTTMNFFSFITTNINFNDKEYDFDTLLNDIKDEFTKKLNKEHFTKKIANNVSTEKNMIVRLIPLFLKKLGVKIGYITLKHAHTTTLSNVGKMDIPDEFKDEIDSMCLTISPSIEEPIKCTICTCNNDLVINFASILETTYIERAFFRKLASDGLNINIESNEVYNEEL